MKLDMRCWLSLFGALLLVLPSCDKKDDPAEPELFRNTKVVFSAEGGTQIVKADGTLDPSWSVTVDADWCSAVSSGTALSITAQPNPALEDRKGTLVLGRPDGAIRFDLLQGGLDAANLTVSAPDHRIDSEGASAYITVTCDTEWSATTDASWLTLSADPDGGLLRATASRNTGETRSATVTVTARDKSGTVTLTQSSRAENAYYSLCGRYRVECERWYFGYTIYNYLRYVSEGPSFDLEFEIKPDSYNRTYLLKDFILTNAQYTLLYDAEADAVQLPCGWYIGTTSGMYACFLVRVDVTVSTAQYYPKYDQLEGTVSADRNSISFESLAIDNFSTVHGLAVVYDDDNGNLRTFIGSQGAYYPIGKVTFVRIDDTATPSAVPAAVTYLPEQANRRISIQ